MRLVIAVTASEARYWIIAYTVLVGILFTALSKLFTALVLALYPENESPNLEVLLVAYYNAGSPIDALGCLCAFAVKALRCDLKGELRKCMRSVCCCCWLSTTPSPHPRKGCRANWKTLRYCLMLAGFSGLLIAGNLVNKFVVNGSRLVVRNAARVNPDAIYYSEVPQNGFDLFFVVQPIWAAAAYQSVSRVAASEKIAKLIEMSNSTYLDDRGRPNVNLNFSYTIVGADMGLQYAPTLKYTVKGRCRTEYSWINTAFNESDLEMDYYPLWNRTDPGPIATEQAISDWALPTWLQAITQYLGPTIPKLEHGDEFALIPGVSHRQSDFPNNKDPWYLTEKSELNSSTPAVADRGLAYQVRRGRPPLYCWQNVTWRLNGKTVYHVVDLEKLGIRISPFLLSVLQENFGSPTLVMLANFLGYAALASSMDTTPRPQAIRTERCSLFKDLERLIQISFVFSRDVVRNIVLLYSAQQDKIGLPNLAADKVTGRVPDSNGDFILESSDVAALSVRTLVAVPSLCLFFWAMVWLLAITSDYEFSNKGCRARFNLRKIAFQAPQLYRYLDEEKSGSKRWSGRMSTPYYESDLEGSLPQSPAQQKPPNLDTVAQDDEKSQSIVPELVPTGGKDHEISQSIEP